jgi:hypothetical protein
MAIGRRLNPDEQDFPNMRRGGTESVYRGLAGSLSTSLRSLGYRSEGARRMQPNEPAPIPTHTHGLATYSGAHGNMSFWHDCQSDLMWDGLVVALVDCDLTEWVPLHPGRFYWPGSSDVRRRARDMLVATTESLGHHYVPRGKQAMLNGGMGCARLGSVKRERDRKYMLGATFTQSCDSGIPIMVSDAMYGDLADIVRDLGQVRGSISGRTYLLDQPAKVGHYNDPRGEYYIAVESIDLRPARLNHAATRASAFITFNSQDARSDWLTSYCGFITGTRRGTIRDAVSWLRDYVAVYGETDATIVSDFDAYHSYFYDVDFPVIDQATGKFAAQTFQKYANETQQPIVVADTYVHVEGDMFENVNNSTITNRSEITFEPLDPGRRRPPAASGAPPT